MFSPVYKHVLLIRQAILQQEVDYLLEVGASGRYGYIDDAMIDESRNRLSQRGFQPSLLQYEVDSTTGADPRTPAAPLPRGVGIKLAIRYPYESLLDIDRLIGIEPPAAGDTISAAGLKMSEYVP
nr:hypothetical protein [Cohnella lubricantis]